MKKCSPIPGVRIEPRRGCGPLIKPLHCTLTRCSNFDQLRPPRYRWNARESIRLADAAHSYPFNPLTAFLLHDSTHFLIHPVPRPHAHGKTGHSSNLQLATCNKHSAPFQNPHATQQPTAFSLLPATQQQQRKQTKTPSLLYKTNTFSLSTLFVSCLLQFPRTNRPPRCAILST